MADEGSRRPASRKGITTRPLSMCQSSLLLLTAYLLGGTNAFLPSTSRDPTRHRRTSWHPFILLTAKKDSASSVEQINGEKEILGPLAAAVDKKEQQQEEEKAATGTVNERLQLELKKAAQKEQYGARSTVGKKLGLDSFKSSKTDEERQATIEAARNLNGVNPVAALAGSVFALAGAAGLWELVSFLGQYFATHPIESDVYFVQRVTAVFRNIVMGFVSLASGFFGVTGLGILLLGVRVAYGVATGELDPTPIKTDASSANKDDEIEISNVWDLMMNKKPGRGRK